jgi:hypothetical protein
MPPDGVGEDDGARAEAPDPTDDDSAGLVRVVEMRVPQARVLARMDAQGPGAGCGLLRAQGDGAARARFPGGEIQDADAVALADGLGERAASGQLDVVGMGSDGQQVHRHDAVSVFRSRPKGENRRPEKREVRARALTPSPNHLSLITHHS